MARCFAKRWLLGLAVLATSTARAQDESWQQPDHLRASNPRDFRSDGTPPAVGKGPVAKVKVEVAPPVANVEKPKREAELIPVQPVVHVMPTTRLTSLPWPKMPHGYQDPTHPVGPAEPGSAAPKRFGPVTAGHAIPRP